MPDSNKDWPRDANPDQAADIANAKAQPLVDEVARLKADMLADVAINGDLLEENTKLRAALEGLLKAWAAYFNPDVGPPGDENKQLLFNQWTDTVAKTYEAIK